MSNINTTKNIFIIPEIAQMTGMSITRVRGLIKSGIINGKMNIKAYNGKGRKVKRMEVTKDDLVKFAIDNPELAGPLVYEEFVQEEIAALIHDTIEESNINEDELAEELSVDEHTEQPAALNASSAELPATEDTTTLDKPDELDVDNAGAFEEATYADTESHDLIESVIGDYIIVLTGNRAALQTRKREIEGIIEEIDYKLERATNALNQICERKCAVNCEE